MMHFEALKKKLSSKLSTDIACSSVAVNLNSGLPAGKPVCQGTGRLVFDRGTIKFEAQLKLTLQQRQELRPYKSGSMFFGLQLVFKDYEGSVWTGVPGLTFVRYQDKEGHALLHGNFTEVDVLVRDEGPPQAGALVIIEETLPVPLSGWSQLLEKKWEMTNVLRVSESTHEFQAGDHLFSVERDFATEELSLKVVSSKPAVSIYYSKALVDAFNFLTGDTYQARFALVREGPGEVLVRVSALRANLHPDFRGAARTLGLEDANRFWDYFGRYFNHSLRHFTEAGDYKKSAVSPLLMEAALAALGPSKLATFQALASAVEGICKTFPEWKSTPSSVSISEAKALSKQLELIIDEPLKTKMKKALESAIAPQQPTVSYLLENLVLEGVIIQQHRKAWIDLRNHVAHGGKITKENQDELEDARELVEHLLQVLTKRVLDRG